MTDEEKKVIEYWEEKLKEYKKEIEQRQNDEFKGYGTAEDIAKLKYCNLHTLLNLIQTQQEEIEKKDKIIDEMANYIWDYDCCEYEIGKEGKCEGYYKNDDCREKCIKEYFINKVKKESKDDN